MTIKEVFEALEAGHEVEVSVRGQWYQATRRSVMSLTRYNDKFISEPARL